MYRLYPSVSLILVLLGINRAFAELARIDDRVTYLATCNGDNLYRSFIDPRYSSSASAFCSTYLRPTSTEAATVTAAAVAQRDLPATTAFPPSRLSSACSCILTATPTPTAPLSCTDADPIVKNGNFEEGTLDPWTVLDSSPALPEYSEYFSYGVTFPGYNSSYSAFTMTDLAASSFVEVKIGQNISVCAGRRYKLSAQVFITNGDSIDPVNAQYTDLYVDDDLLASAPSSYLQGPPIVWKPLSGEFVAMADVVAVIVRFTAVNIVVAQWGVDDVVVMPI